MFQQGSNAPEPVTSKEVVLNNFLLTDLTATSSRPHIGFELNMSFFNRQDTAYAFETNIRSAASIR
jgi:hypothetical protein